MTQLHAATLPTTVAEVVSFAAGTHGDSIAMRFKRAGKWQEVSYVDLADSVRQLAVGLDSVGVRPGDRVALLAETRPEWTACDLAIATVGAACVPVYPTNSPDECAWVIGDSGAKVVVCENQEQVDKVASVRDRLPALELVVVIDPEGEVTAGEISLEELRSRGAAGDPAVLGRADPGDVATIVYTSGTTGPPKGCLLTHHNWLATLNDFAGRTTMGPGDVVYLYLPLAHLFARTVQLVTFGHGGTLCYFGGTISGVVAELAEVKPTQLPSVPRLFEKVYAKALALIESQSPEDQQWFHESIALGLDVRRRRERGEPVSAAEQQRFDEADQRLFSLVRGIFGGRVREALTGAAPIAVEILEFCYACGVPIYEAYGMTESTAIISTNLPGAVKFGTVGRPLDGVRVRIAADGEVLAAGDNLFIGYHGNEAATRETLVDGWLHTGDLGQLDADGYLSITGRKKDIIICAGGKNLTPANLENDLRQSRWISHAVMHGDRRPYPVALITLDAEEILPWAQQRGLPGTVAELAGHPKVQELVQQVLDAANSKYAPPEQIRRFAILDHDFSMDTGTLTPSLKIRRQIVHQTYAHILDTLYTPK